MCFSFTPCYFAIIHIKYHIKMSPLAPHAFLGMPSIFTCRVCNSCIICCSITMQSEKREFEVPGFHGRLSTQLYELQQRGEMCDSVIATNNGNVPVHRLILMASRSPVLIVSCTKLYDNLCLQTRQAEVLS